MSYTIETIAERISARRVGDTPANIDWLLTDSRSLSFPEETLFFALTTKRNDGARYIPDLYSRGVRNFVVSKEAYKWVESGQLAMSNSDMLAVNFLVVANPLKALQKLAERNPYPDPPRTTHELFSFLYSFPLFVYSLTKSVHSYASSGFS